MKRTVEVLLLGLLAGGLLNGCSDQKTSLLPAEPDAAPGTAGQDNQLQGLTSFIVPGAVATFAKDINVEGVIVGRYETVDGALHGFLRRTTGEIVTIDVPGAVFTNASSINDQGDIVGQYSAKETPDVRHAFLLRNGRFTTIDAPGSLFTNAEGINNQGIITGRYFPKDEDVPHGYWVRGGRFNSLEFPGATETHAWKSNDRGDIVGGFISAEGRSHVFVKHGDALDMLPLPTNKVISMSNGDINSRGDVLGIYCGDESCADQHGFLLSDGGRRFRTIDVPGATSTFTIGMNERGVIVGGYVDETGLAHGFLMSGTTR